MRSLHPLNETFARDFYIEQILMPQSVLTYSVLRLKYRVHNIS